jgi:hypothetical protein
MLACSTRARASPADRCNIPGNQPLSAAKTRPPGDTPGIDFGHQVQHHRMNPPRQRLHIPQCLRDALVVQTAQGIAQAVQAIRHRLYRLAHCDGHAPILSGPTDNNWHPEGHPAIHDRVNAGQRFKHFPGERERPSRAASWSREEIFILIAPARPARLRKPWRLTVTTEVSGSAPLQHRRIRPAGLSWMLEHLPAAQHDQGDRQQGDPAEQDRQRHAQ